MLPLPIRSVPRYLCPYRLLVFSKAARNHKRTEINHALLTYQEKLIYCRYGDDGNKSNFSLAR